MNPSNLVLAPWTSPPDGECARMGGEYPRWTIKGSRLAGVSFEEKLYARIISIGIASSIAANFAGDFPDAFARRAATTLPLTVPAGESIDEAIDTFDMEKGRFEFGVVRFD